MTTGSFGFDAFFFKSGHFVTITKWFSEIGLLKPLILQCFWARAFWTKLSKMVFG